MKIEPNGQTRKHPGWRLPEGATHWNLIYRTRVDNDTSIVIRFYDAEGHVIEEGEY